MEPQGAEPVVALAPERPTVEPGGEVMLTATVHNPGGIVEEYELEVLGVPAPWTTLDPPALSSLPGESHDVRLIVRPPRDPTTPAGPQPIGLRVMSRENPGHIGIGETDLVVGGVHDLEATLTPVRDRARWSGRWTLDLVNRGSEPAPLTVAAEDSRQGLTFAVAPSTVTVQPGDKATVFLRAKSRKPKLVGQPTRHAFTVTRKPTGPGISAARAVLAGKHEGSFEQVPVLPKAALAVGGLLAVGAALLFAFVLKSDPAAVADTALAPPASAIGGLTAIGPDAIRLTWKSNPYAKDYVVQRVSSSGPAGIAGDSPGEAVRNAVETAADEVQVLDSIDVKGDRNSFDVKGLEPATQHCFRLVAKNDDGASVPSPARCARTQAGPKPSSSESGSGDPSASESPSSSESPSTSQSPTGGTSTGPDGNPVVTAPGTDGTDVTGHFVVAATYQRADESIQKTGQHTVALLAQNGVTKYKLVDGDKTVLFFRVPGTQYIVVDNLASETEADELCDRLRLVDQVFADCIRQR